MSTAMYVGSFDPPTLGHADIAKRAAAQYDHVVIVIAYNPRKNGLFLPVERKEMLLRCLPGARAVFLRADGILMDETWNLPSTAKYQVMVMEPGGLSVNLAKKVGATALVRGLRAVSDFDAEFQMALMNREQTEDVDTVLFMTSKSHLFTSSSNVREVAALGGNIDPFVEPFIKDLLAAKYGKAQ